jgi:heme exporter protein D
VNWGSWSEFWAMGGYGSYVWGSFAMTAAVVIVEIWRLKVRRDAAVSEVVSEARRRGVA